MYKRLLGVLAATAIFASGLLPAQTPVSPPAQTSPAPLTFEVAAIKPAPPLDPAKIMSGKMHIGVNVNKGRVDIGNLSLSDLIRMAFKIKPYQLNGPDWMGAQRFDIQAKMPDGSNKDQMPEMLQALLADRFKLAIHRESKEHSVYALVVGKGGIKMKEAEPDPPPAKPAADAAEGDAPPDEPPGKGGMVVGSGENRVRVTPSPDGKGSTITGGKMGQMKISMADGMMHWEFSKMKMEVLVDMLSQLVDKPVVDQTELKGNYQVALALSVEEMQALARKAGAAAGMMMPMGGGGGDTSRTPSAAASTPSASAFAAVQQLGLKLESRKAPIELIVVDHLEKTPTEN